MPIKINRFNNKLYKLMESTLKSHDVLEYRPAYQEIYGKENVKISLDHIPKKCCVRYSLWVRKKLNPKQIP